MWMHSYRRCGEDKLITRMQEVCDAIKNDTPVPRKRAIDSYTVKNVAKSLRKAIGIYKIEFNLIEKKIAYILESSSWHLHTTKVIEVQYIPSKKKVILLSFKAGTDMEDIRNFNDCVVNFLGDLLYPHPIEDFISDERWKGAKIESLNTIDLRNSFGIKFKGFYYTDSSYNSTSTYGRVKKAFFKTHNDHVSWQKTFSDLDDEIREMVFRKHFNDDLVQKVTKFVESKYEKPAYWDEKVVKPTIPKHVSKLEFNPKSPDAKKILRQLKKMKLVHTSEPYVLFIIDGKKPADELEYRFADTNEFAIRESMKQQIRDDTENKFALCKIVQTFGKDLTGKNFFVSEWKAFVNERWIALKRALKSDNRYIQLQFMDFDKIKE